MATDPWASWRALAGLEPDPPRGATREDAIPLPGLTVTAERGAALRRDVGASALLRDTLAPAAGRLLPVSRVPGGTSAVIGRADGATSIELAPGTDDRFGLMHEMGHVAGHVPDERGALGPAASVLRGVAARYPEYVRRAGAQNINGEDRNADEYAASTYAHAMQLRTAHPDLSSDDVADLDRLRPGLLDAWQHLGSRPPFSHSQQRPQPFLSGRERPLFSGGALLPHQLDAAVTEQEHTLPASPAETEHGLHGSLGRTLGRGLAESGQATLRGVADLGRALDHVPGIEAIPGAGAIAGLSRADALSPERLADESAGIRYEYGDPQSGAETAGMIGSRLVGDLAQFMAPGAIAGKLGIAGAEAEGLRGIATRTALNVGATAPLTAAQAANPETSATQFLADETGSPFLRSLAGSVPGRVAGDLALDTGLTGAVEAVVPLARAARGALAGVRTPVERGRAIGAALLEDVRAGRVNLAAPPPPIAMGESLAAEGAAARAEGRVLPVSMDDPRLAAPTPTAVRRAVADREAQAGRDMMFRGAPSPQPQPAMMGGRAEQGLVDALARTGVGAAAGGAVGAGIDDQHPFEGAALGAAAGAGLGAAAPAIARELPDLTDVVRSSERGAVHTPVLGAITGAGIGAASGAALNDDNPLEGALAGGAIGALGGAAAGHTLTRPRTGPLPLPASLKPVYQAAERSIDFTGALARSADREAKGTFRARFERMLDAFSSGQGPIQRLGEASGLRPTRNPRDLLSQVRNVDATVRRAFFEGVPHPVSRSTTIGPSFASVVEPLGDNPRAIRQAFTYAVSERLLGRGLEGFGGDAVKHAQAQALVQHFRSVPEIQEFSKRLRSYIDSLGEYAVGSGLWTPEQWQAIRDSDALYIPTQRIMGGNVPRGAQIPSMGSGAGKLSNIGPGVKKFTGSARAVYDPAAALAEYTSSIIRRADTYRASAAIIEAADALGPEGELLLTRLPSKASALTVDTRKAIATRRAEALGVSLPSTAVDAIDDLLPVAVDSKNPVIWRNLPGGGRDERLINSPDLLHAVSGLQGMGEDGLRRLLDITIRPLKRIFTATTTAFSLPFTLVTNPGRDIVDTLAKSRAGVTPLDLARGYAEAIGGAFGASRLDRTLKEYGLGHVTLWHDAAHTSPRQFQHEVAPTTGMQRTLARARKGALRASGITLLESLGNASESGFRNAEGIASIRRSQHLVDSGAWTVDDQMLRAATEGREIIDFTNRPGAAGKVLGPTSAVLREMSNYIPFFGAALQGGATMTRAAMRNPKRVASVASGLAASAAVAWALKHRSQEVLDRENDRMPSERGGFLFFPLDDAGQWTVRIPMPQELGVAASGVTAGLDAWRDHDPHAADSFIESLLRALPPGVSEAARGRPTIPVPGVQQWLENRANRRDFGGAPIESQEMQGLPPAERRRDSTPLTADLIAAGARRVGLEDLSSPVKAENLMRGVTSRYTPYITAVTDPFAEMVLGRGAPDAVPSSSTRSPINPLSGLLANPNPSATASQERYYGTRTRAQQANASIRAAAEAGDAARALRTFRDYPDVANDVAQQIVGAADSEIAQWREAEDVVRQSFHNKEIDGERARQMLDQIGERRRAVYREADRLLTLAAARNRN